MTGFLPVRPSIFYALLLDKRGEMCPPPFLQILVEFVENDQRQDRAEWGPLRRSFVTGSHKPIGQNTRTEVAPYEADKHLVPAAALQRRHQSIVIDSVEEFCKVHFDNPRASSRYVALRLLDGLMCTASRSEAVAEFRECGGRSAPPEPARWPVGSDDPVPWESPACACRRQVWECRRASRGRECIFLHECERRCSPNGGESALRARRRSFRLRPEHLCWLSPAYMPGACSAARGLSPVRSLNLLLSSSAWPLLSALVGLWTHILPQTSGLRSVWALLFRFDLRYCRRIRECHALYLHNSDSALQDE